MKFIITEEDKKHIKQLYGLITEQETTPSSGTSIDRRVIFPAGYYNESYVSDTLTEVTQQISTFLSQNSGTSYIVSITLESGESQIPNTDREQGNIPVEPGVLARARQATINSFLTRSIGELVTSGVLPQMPTFNFTEPVIGATPWVGTPFCPANATDAQQRSKCVDAYRAGMNTTYKDYKTNYDAEQFVRVIVVVSQGIIPTTTGTTSLECATNMVIELNYEGGKNHICDSSVYQLYANDVLLLRDDGKDYASLNNYTPKELVGKKTHGLSLEDSIALQAYDNNLGKAGGKRYNKFIITSEMAKELFKGGKTRIKIQAMCYNPTNYIEDGKDNMLGFGKPETHPWEENCHDYVGVIKVTNASGQFAEFEPRNTPSQRNRKVTMFTFDPCVLKKPE
jgi:hypothetical protein